MTTNASNAAQDGGSSSGKKIVVIDIGKKKRKKVKQLRKGEGSLALEIEQTVEQLKLEGALDSNAQTVVVVVRQKPKNNWMWPS